MADVRDVKVSISLREYTDLVCAKNDFEKVKIIVGNCTDGYMGASETAFLKALCRICGKETEA